MHVLTWTGPVEKASEREIHVSAVFTENKKKEA